MITDVGPLLFWTTMDSIGGDEPNYSNNQDHDEQDDSIVVDKTLD